MDGWVVRSMDGLGCMDRYGVGCTMRLDQSLTSRFYWFSRGDWMELWTTVLMHEGYAIGWERMMERMEWRDEGGMRKG